MVSIILPTYNESEHLAALVRSLFETAGSNKIQLEVIVVDDNSPDGTGELAYYLKKFFPKLKTLHRSQRLGKTSALIEGTKLASGNIIGYMDADASHDPAALPGLIKPLISGHIDITVASRYIAGAQQLAVNPLTRISSRLLSLLSKPLTSVRDPWSSYFFVRTSIFKKFKFDPASPNLLMYLLMRASYDTVQEIPYIYRGQPGKKIDSGLISHFFSLIKQFFVSYRIVFLNK